MIVYFFLAMLGGIMLKFLAKVGISYCIGKAHTEDQLRGMLLFHIGVASYVLGTVLHVGSLTIGLAWMLKELL